jgi:3-phenylpropionate/cinnamic acid dioxygenase small subunit
MTVEAAGNQTRLAFPATSAPSGDKELRQRRVPTGDARYFQALEWLVEEAEALDEDRMDDWLTMLADDITYRMPVRVTVHRRDGDGFLGEMGHFEEDILSLQTRVRRLTQTDSAWSEDPPSRTRRHVTNVRVETVPDSDMLHARSYLFLVRSRWDDPDFEFLSAERRDLLRPTPSGKFQLARRTIRVDQSNLGNINMALLL